MKKNADGEAHGISHLTGYQQCWPSGVPQVLNLREPIQLLQERDQVTILYQRDHQVRRVYLNVPHRRNLPKTWYGESVGHYEGRTLVVDTIGQNDKSEADRFGTPHSDQIHVVERYTVSPDGTTLHVVFTVTDPKAFTMPWTGVANYRRAGRAGAGQAVLQEVVCAENNYDVLTKKEFDVPRAAAPDF